MTAELGSLALKDAQSEGRALPLIIEFGMRNPSSSMFQVPIPTFYHLFAASIARNFTSFTPNTINQKIFAAEPNRAKITTNIKTLRPSGG